MIKICLILWGFILVLAVFTSVPECFCWFCKGRRKAMQLFNNIKERYNGNIK